MVGRDNILKIYEHKSLLAEKSNSILGLLCQSAQAGRMVPPPPWGFLAPLVLCVSTVTVRPD